MRNAGGGGQKLRVGGGHRGGEDARQQDARDDCEEGAVRGDYLRDGGDEVLGSGGACEHLDSSGLCHAVADDADDDRDGEGDNDPDRADAAGGLELVFVVYRHEVGQNVRHAEVAERPRDGGGDIKRRVGRSLCALDGGS